MVLQHPITGVPESPYTAIARVTSHARPRRLVLLLAAAVATLAIAANAAASWPLPALALGSAAAAVGCAALWGVAAHAAEGRQPATLRLLERALAAIGTALAAVAVIALMLSLLGDPWQL